MTDWDALWCSEPGAFGIMRFKKGMGCQTLDFHQWWRKATIEIRWEGPDKKVREFIEDKLDELFFDLTMDVPGVTFADGSTQFWSKVPS